MKIKQFRIKRIPQGMIIATAMAVMVASAAADLIVDLGTAGNFAILSKAGISTTAGTAIVGDIGVSPIAASGLTGFGLTEDSSGEFSTSALVDGKVYAANYAAPTPSMLGTAIGDLEIAYNDAAGRSGPDFLNLESGNLNGQTLAPGLYKWGSAVTITDGITIDGGADDIWIFQIDNRLNLANGANIVLSGGAQAQNIFWQTAEGATLGTTSQFKGILLTATDISVQTGASVNGNLYAKTAVTLDSNAITEAIPEPASVMLVIFSGVGLLVAKRWLPH